VVNIQCSFLPHVVAAALNHDDETTPDAAVTTKVGGYYMNQSQNSALSYGPHVCSSFK
jgi:hypothetical protein